MERAITLPKVTKDIGELLSEAHSKDNRECLLKILSSVGFLARQGLALRGDGDESDNNYIQLLQLRDEDDPKVLECMKRRNEKYTCSDSQDEMLKIMALSILEEGNRIATKF